MKRLFYFLLGFCLMALLLPVLSFADSVVRIQWDACTGDVVGYRAYQTDVSGTYVYGPDSCVGAVSHPIVTVDIPNVVDGTHFWVVTSFDAEGNESGPSNEVTVNIDTVAPDAPTSLNITRWHIMIQ